MNREGRAGRTQCRRKGEQFAEAAVHADDAQVLVAMLMPWSMCSKVFSSTSFALGQRAFGLHTAASRRCRG
jgi:hypothetical protein